MFVFIDLYIKILTAFLGWGSFVVAGLTGISLLLGRKRKLLGWCCVGYAVAFLIVRFFFSELYVQWMPVIAILLGIISTIWSRYKDRVNGKRWWNR